MNKQTHRAGQPLQEIVFWEALTNGPGELSQASKHESRREDRRDRDRALLSISQSRVVEEGTHDSSLQEAPCTACESQVVAFHFEEIAEC